ncbi:T9SS type A sorting domain-containing protein [Microvirga sp. STR05]|uniref:T9SS type A sorting domain-containing protein n=1 Tax=Hymenobacter duratus TaxID=2771356 RepID=A0ABR8JDM9_9BACT|nr:PA14 domain-containing protein [Hymenobacter duratus]MBD2713728.1 T9SS type A sorting domain-containing protein [Hymenobacter duratus]MBR7948630.1 T9SS type A sorting domain-containing protein [Microvirga sp. STR05]
MNTTFRGFSMFVVWLLMWSGNCATGQAQPTGCAGLNPGGQPAGAGLYAEYYSGYFADDQTYFTAHTAGITRIDAQVNFPNSGFGDLTAVAANTLADPDDFSLRQRGSLSITTPGLYTFYLTSDDASYFWLGNAALASPAVAAQATIAHGGLHSASVVRQASLYLVAGLHNVLLHYGETGSANTLILEYEGPDAPQRQLVPASAFCTSVQPFRNLPTAILYSPRHQTVLPGTGAASPVPTLAGTGATPHFMLANATSLPAGISINAVTGQLTLAAGVGNGLYQADVLVVDNEGAVRFRQVYTFTVATAAPAGCAGSRPDGGLPTQGLYAEYYRGYFDDDPAFFNASLPDLTRLEPQFNFPTNDSWGNLALAASGPASNPDHYSARFRGSFTVFQSGTYTLYLTSDDGSRLWLDDAALPLAPLNSAATINNGGRHRDSTVAVAVALAAGQHDVQVQYGEDGDNNKLVLEYEGPDAPTRRVMPTGIFCSGSSGRPLAVRQDQDRLRISVAPNPSQGSFEVHIEKLPAGTGRLRVVDMQGRTCYEANLASASKQTLQVPGLTSGLYLLRLTTITGEATQKIVVE